MLSTDLITRQTDVVRHDLSRVTVLLCNARLRCQRILGCTLSIYFQPLLASGSLYVLGLNRTVRVYLTRVLLYCNCFALASNVCFQSSTVEWYSEQATATHLTSTDATPTPGFLYPFLQHASSQIQPSLS